MYNRRFNDKSDRTDRWRREDAAPRLGEEVPTLTTLVLSLREAREGHAVPGSERKQHVIVSRAAALFEVACGETRCDEGGHDLTHDVLYHLRNGDVEFTGHSECQGTVGAAPCHRTLHYSALATYQKP